MSGHITAIRWIAIAAPFLVWGMCIGVPVKTARADNCLTAPNSDPPKGGHWYYRTDRKKGRKCWFLRAVDGTKQHTAARNESIAAPTTYGDAVKKPATEAAGTPASQSAGGDAAPLVQAKPRVATTSSAATREPVRHNSQEQSAAPSAPATPTPNTSVWTEPDARAPAAAPTTRIIWPDPPMLAPVKVQKANSVPSSARRDADPAALDLRASPDSEDAARAGTPAIGAAKITAASGGTFVQTSLVVALGLIVGGLLYRLVMKISAARGQRIYIDRSESDWVDDRREQLQEFIIEKVEFIDDARLSLVPVVGEYGAPHPLQVDDNHQNYALRKGRASRLTEQVIERENTLVQLLRDLDQMLKSRRGA